MRESAREIVEPESPFSVNMAIGARTERRNESRYLESAGKGSINKINENIGIAGRWAGRTREEFATRLIIKLVEPLWRNRNSRVSTSAGFRIELLYAARVVRGSIFQ